MNIEDMKTKNTYMYPLADVKEGMIESHESPAHVDTLEYAVDFIVPEGTPVIAAADGIVIEVKSDSATGGSEKELEPFGNFVEIEHLNREYSEYEHLKKDGAMVRAGDKVTRGQLIGYSGATGWLAHLGPHLHFMVGIYGETDHDYQTLKIQWAEKAFSNSREG